jgi:hypothetical protein
MSRIIRKPDPTQLTSDFNLDSFVSQPPQLHPQPQSSLEISDEVQSRLLLVMKTYLIHRDKLAQLAQIKKQIEHQSKQLSAELTTLMKFYGLTDLTIGADTFRLEQIKKTKPVGHEDFKKIINLVINDPDKIKRIYDMAEQSGTEVTQERYKCVKTDTSS